MLRNYEPEPNKRIKRNPETGEAQVMLDAASVPRYLYDDGSMDTRSVADPRAGLEILVSGCEAPSETAAISLNQIGNLATQHLVEAVS